MVKTARSYHERLEWLNHVTVEDVAAEIKKSGFGCVRCGRCCISLKMETGDPLLERAQQECGGLAMGNQDYRRHVFHTNRLTIDGPEVERILEATGMSWFDVARPSPPTGVGSDGELRSLLWLLRYNGVGENLGDCYFYDHASGACTIYEKRPLLCRSHPFCFDVVEGEATLVLQCPYGTRDGMSSEDALRYAESTLAWYRTYFGLTHLFEQATGASGIAGTRETDVRKFRANLKKRQVIFQVTDSTGVRRVLMRVGGKAGQTYRFL